MKIICIIRYEIDPFQREAFKEYAQNRGRIIPRCGGELVGYFLPWQGTITTAQRRVDEEDRSAPLKRCRPGLARIRLNACLRP